MPFTSGTFGLYTPGNPTVTGTTISSTWANNTLNDIATALTQSIASTGVTTPTANLPMGTFRHTGVGNATAQACYASVTDVQNGSAITLSGVSGTDTITATAPFTVAAYASGQGFRFVAANTNTGAVTINISGLGAKSITKQGTTALNAGDIAAGGAYEIVYDGTRFQLIGARQGGAVGALTVNSRSSNTIFGTGDLGSVNQFTNTFTQTFTAAATLGAGWYVDVQNIGTGVITFDANGTETFNTQSGARQTIAMYPGEGFRIVCNGTSFDLVGRSSKVQLGVAQVASSSTLQFETGFTDTEFSKIEFSFWDILVSSTSFAIRVKKSGAYISGSSYYSGFSWANGATAVSLGPISVAYLFDTTSASQELSGNLTVVKPQSTSGASAIFADIACPEYGVPKGVRAIIGATETTVAAIQGIQFCTIGGGTIDAGSIVSYGVRG